MQHLIDGIITSIIQTLINGKIDDITAALPFARSRTPQEKEHLAVMGPKRYAVMVIVFNVMQAHPSIFPASFNQANFTKSYQLLQVLDAIIARLETLMTLIGDTRLLVASDLYANSMQAYEFEKGADKRGDAPIHDSIVHIAELMKHTTKDPVVVLIPAAGSVVISDIETSKQVFVIGPAAVSIREETAPINTSVKWVPLTSYSIPDGMKVIVFTNLSATDATSISYLN